MPAVALVAVVDGDEVLTVGEVVGEVDIEVVGEVIAEEDGVDDPPPHEDTTAMAAATSTTANNLVKRCPLANVDMVVAPP